MGGVLCGVSQEDESATVCFWPILPIRERPLCREQSPPVLITFRISPTPRHPDAEGQKTTLSRRLLRSIGCRARPCESRLSRGGGDFVEFYAA
jgi:hypothetical protein